MTDRTWTGAQNNSARDPNNWSPTGVPVPGDTLAMQSGMMNIRDNDLAGGTVVFGTDETLATGTLNLSHHATASLGLALGASADVTINVKGSDTLNVNHEAPGGLQLTVDLADHASLTGAFLMTFGGVALTGGDGSRFVNNGSSLFEGTSVKLDTSVVGKGSITLTGNQSAGGPLEFGGSVSRGQDVSVTGEEDRDIVARVQVDQPEEFKAAVTLGVFGEVDLVGLTNADSYQLRDDILSIYSGCKVIDTLRLTAPPPPFGGPTFDVTVSRTSTGVAIDRGAIAFGSTPLPMHS